MSMTAMTHEYDGGLCWCGPKCDPVAFVPVAQGSGEPSPCAGCGGDGVQIDDDPESTRQIVSTCGECRGSGSEGRGSDDA